jgi:Na+-translocating ferredoxin:NAD+ oxidoreductase subunit D
MSQGWIAPFAAGRTTGLPGTSMAVPFMTPTAAYDSFSGATPLAAVRLGDGVAPVADLWLGNVAGSVGETSALLLLLGGLYLVAVRAVDWRIPAAVLGA